MVPSTPTLLPPRSEGFAEAMKYVSGLLHIAVNLRLLLVCRFEFWSRHVTGFLSL